MSVNDTTCIQCQMPLDSRTEGVYRQLKGGWAEQRRGGGAHGVTLAEWGDQYLCRFCVDKRKRGLENQGQLL